MWFKHIWYIFLSLAVVALGITFPLTNTLAEEENLPVISETVVIPNYVSGVILDDPSDDLFPMRYGPLSNEQLPIDPTFRGLNLRYATPEYNNIGLQFAARSGYGFTRDGELNSRYQSRELRIGNVTQRAIGRPAWYFFVADEDEALIWDPGVTSVFGTQGSEFALRDQVEIGDLQVGVAYEYNGWQTTFSYVEREVGARVGAQHWSQDENFVGVTVTYQHQAP